MEKLAFIGFGEAATAFASDWSEADLARTVAYDIRSNCDPDVMSARYAQSGVTGAKTNSGAATDAGLIFSLVTADQAIAAATETARAVDKQLFLDCNSVSPNTKRRNRDVLETAGARYVDVAVMAPVHPARTRTPLLISGPHATEAAKHLTALGMNATVVDGEVGHASAIKMIRSVFVKGLEAITAECVLAGRKAGIDGTVIASLEKTYPGLDLTEAAGYMLSRMIEHGPRRAAEMDEAARTVREFGLSGAMSAAAADWQRTIGNLALDTDAQDYPTLSDALLQSLDGGKFGDTH